MSYLHSYETLAREIYTKLKTIKGRLSFDEITKILTPINNIKLSIYILKCSRKKKRKSTYANNSSWHPNWKGK